MEALHNPSAVSPDLIAERGYLFLGSRLKRLAEQMQADVSKVSQRAGIALFPGQFPLLAILSETGNQTIGALAMAMGLSQPVTTRNINRLIEAGMVKVDPSDTDGRSKVVSLTASGDQAMQRSKQTVLPHIEAAVKQIVDGRSDTFLEQLWAIESALGEESLATRAGHIAASELVPATNADIPLIAAMMNEAYRGSTTKSRWTTEADYITGDRTTEDLLLAERLANPAGTFLTWRDAPDSPSKGSVWIQPLADDAWYLGSLTVDPHRQNAGLGHALLYCAEQWIQMRGGKRVELTVVNLRKPLIEWYLRRGYRDTGRTEAFPYGDDRFGRPLRDDLCFVVLEKEID
jgi:DNA-binding MarR family transcriptional regulator/ribosomal protein S18 acetylase RimI-like enzyme